MTPDVHTAVAHVAGLPYVRFGQLCDRCGALLQSSHQRRYWTAGVVVVELPGTFALAELCPRSVLEAAVECAGVL